MMFWRRNNKDKEQDDRNVHSGSNSTANNGPSGSNSNINLNDKGNLNDIGLNIQNIVNSALKSAGQVNVTGSFTKTVNGKVVQASDEDIKAFEQTFKNFGSHFSGNPISVTNISFGEEEDQAASESIVECPGCRARNSIKKGQIGICEYCGSKISG